MIIVVIDYGMGNIGSIINMLRKVGVDATSSSDHHTIRGADKLVLPGVGAFDHGVRHLEELGLRSILNERVGSGVPILGICLGMQILGDSSEEGNLSGLGWISAKTVRFAFQEGSSRRYKVPHMGWNYIKLIKPSPLFDGLEEKSRYYFVHSYHFVPDNTDDVMTTTEYGIPFISSVQHKNIYGVQFHPEKSHRFGLQLFSNFVSKT